MKRPLRVVGMHGLGDNLHQRALVRQLMRKHTVYLETVWASVYHDLIADGLNVIRRPTKLRTQAKNAEREADRFFQGPVPECRTTRIWYPPHVMRQHGAVLAAMCAEAGCDYATADFRLPIPLEWQAKADAILERLRPHKPVMIYRPLVERTEWSGCANRNPIHEHYAELFDAIRDRYFVISVADLVPGVEWQTGLACEADARFHHGELEFETLAALTARASLVFASPGFAVVLAQAVSTPAVCVFGGYEGGRSFDGGALFSRYLPIAPIRPCPCFSHTHKCDKRIDMPNALKNLLEFAR